jgi:hypothetical protein
MEEYGRAYTSMEEKARRYEIFKRRQIDRSRMEPVSALLNFQTRQRKSATAGGAAVLVP